MKHEDRARAALQSLIRERGGPTQMAREMGIKRQMIEQWDLIPLTYIRDTWKLYRMGLNELRPDIAELAKLK